jgi:hypothetical protein
VNSNRAVALIAKGIENEGADAPTNGLRRALNYAPLTRVYVQYSTDILHLFLSIADATNLADRLA